MLVRPVLKENKDLLVMMQLMELMELMEQ